VPLVFFLLANKHQTSYEDVLRHSVSQAAKLGGIFFSNKTAIHKAVKTVWPGCEVKE
jgi:hypothetical protein